MLSQPLKEKYALSTCSCGVTTYPALGLVVTQPGVGCNHSSSERSERFVRFEPNVRSERVRYYSERETNVQALKRLINLIALK